MGIYCNFQIRWINIRYKPILKYSLREDGEIGLGQKRISGNEDPITAIISNTLTTTADSISVELTGPPYVPTFHIFLGLVTFIRLYLNGSII
jgi:hypothetical protein